MPTHEMAERVCQSNRRVRGFTLAELMAVVTIVSVLATLAIYSVHRYVNSSRTTEATAVIQAIRAAQESYRAENHQYLNVSQGNLEDFYPAAPDAQNRPFFLNDDSDRDLRWRLLGPVVKRRVRFGYACVAGLAGEAPPPLQIQDPPAWGATTEPWYVIQAVSDFDGGGSQGRMVATSFTSEIYSEPE